MTLAACLPNVMNDGKGLLMILLRYQWISDVWEKVGVGGGTATSEQEVRSRFEGGTDYCGKEEVRAAIVGNEDA